MFDDVPVGFIEKPVNPSKPRDLEEGICFMVFMIPSSVGILHKLSLSMLEVFSMNRFSKFFGKLGSVEENILWK